MDPDTPYYVNFSGASNDTLFQVYCLNPPSDSCDYGPCPNPDVTGVGQQISPVYITSTIFAITIIHTPQDFRLAAYTYLANIYSLLISGLVAMLKVQLTQNDAVFVVVATISPATLYLWITAPFVLVTGFPNRIARGIPNKHERVLIALSSFISFALWVTMLSLINKPSQGVKFSQPGCNKTYGKEQLTTLFWSLTFFLQLFVEGLVLFFVAVYLRRRSRNLTVPQSSPNTASEGLATWTRTSLNRDFPSLGLIPIRVDILMLIMQISVVDYSSLGIEVMPYSSLAALSMTSFLHIFSSVQTEILFYLYVCFVCMSLRSSRSGKHIFWGSLQMVVLSVLTVMFIVYFQTAPDLVHDGIWSAIWWKHAAKSYAGQHRLKIAVRRLVPILGIFAISFMPVAVIFPSQLWWFCIWEIYSFTPSISNWETIELLWVGTMDSAPLLKFMFLIVGPTVTWFQSTIIPNPAKSSTMTFGQIFAVIIAVASLSNLIFTFRENVEAIRKAVWMVENSVLATAVIGGCSASSIPMHTRHPSSPGSPHSPATVNDPNHTASLMDRHLEDGTINSALTRVDLDNPTRRRTR